jgi:hypothetical protein
MFIGASPIGGRERRRARSYLPFSDKCRKENGSNKNKKIGKSEKEKT